MKLCLLTIGLSLLVGIGFRFADIIIRPNQIILEQTKHDRRVMWVAAFLSSILEEAEFRLWLLLLPSWLVWPAVIVSSIVFQIKHLCYRTIFFHFVMGVVFSILLLYFGWWASVVAHLTFCLSGVAYVEWRRRSDHILFSCFGNIG